MNVVGDLVIAGLERLAADPTTELFVGRMYYRTTDNKPRVYMPSGWQMLGDSGVITGAVASVNGLQGIVTLTSAEIPEGASGPYYFTDAKAKAAVVDNAINDGVTDKAPSHEAVHTALSGKQSVGNYLTDLTGDGLAHGPGTGNLQLVATGITPGTYTKVTVDTKGRATSGGSITVGDIPPLPANQIPKATAAVDGYLGATDFATFNSKQNAGSYITGLTGDVAASGPGNVAATILDSTVTGKLLTGLTLALGTPAAGDTILAALGKLANRINTSWLGNGSDGDVTITSGTTTLLRDMCYNSLQVNAGAILKVNGFGVFCKNTCVINGTVDRKGVSATNGSGAAALAGGFYLGSAAGGSGSTTVGVAGTATTSALGGRGGAGGAGTGGAGATYGNATLPAASNGGAERMQFAITATTGYLPSGSTRYSFGAGGGGGGGDGTSVSGGGGGSGGAYVMICAGSISGTGTIDVSGGNGANGLGVGAGGGGGGGGGAIALVSISDTTSIGVTLNVSGGLGGAAGGAGGVAGSPGLAGNVYRVRI